MPGGLALHARLRQRDQQRVLEAVGEVCRRGRRDDSSWSGRMSAAIEAASAGGGRWSSLSVQPSRSRSMAAQATITALSVHRRSGGARRRSHGRRRCVPGRREGWRWRPLRRRRPARGRAHGRPRNIAIAWAARSASISATALLEAGGDVGGVLGRERAGRRSAATSWATAVFRPEKEKSQPGRPQHGARECEAGRGRRPRASRSSAGPPGQPRPSSLATLSKASPMASSMVPPRRR